MNFLLGWLPDNDNILSYGTHALINDHISSRCQRIICFWKRFQVIMKVILLSMSHIKKANYWGETPA